MQSARCYLNSFLNFAGTRAITGFALVLLSAILEGVGLLAFVPFLAIFTGDASDPNLARRHDASSTFWRAPASTRNATSC